ncbi:MAG: HAD-IA family hydrolase [Cytophagales bacterium]|nr:HAD-IA family hydrolase [Cytophagales bacterium]
MIQNNKINVPGHIKGLIFDLDGTIADTMPAHYLSWVYALRKHGGIDFSEEQFYGWAGISTRKIIAMLNDLHSISMDIEHTFEDKENYFLKILHEVKPIMPVIEVIHKYHGVLPMSIGTGGVPHFAMLTLEQVHCQKYFDIIVCSTDVQNPKPAPDTFLLCAQKMSVSPTNCMVFEDSHLGIQAAHSAGMHAINIKEYL